MVRRGNRVVAIAGLAVGVGVLVVLLIQDRAFAPSLWTASGCAIAVMVVGLLFVTLMRNPEATVEEVTGPAGLGMKLARAARHPMAVLERRSARQFKVLNDRIFELEKKVERLEKVGHAKESPPVETE